jgi:hypothetical protein
LQISDRISCRRMLVRFGIVPDLGRKGAALRVVAPVRLEVRGFLGKDNARIAKQLVIHLPCLDEGRRLFGKHPGVVAKRKKPCCVKRQNAHAPTGTFSKATEWFEG